MFNSFIRRPVLSIVISLVVVFLGLLALMNLPVTQFPSISPPKVNITVEYPGVNNELMVKSVIIPLEQSLNGIQGLKYMTSDAGNDGEGSIQLVFNLGTDPNIAAETYKTEFLPPLTNYLLLLFEKGLKLPEKNLTC